MNPPKAERNKQIVKLRNEGKTFEEIARNFNITRQTAYRAYHRDKKKYAKQLTVVSS